MNKFWEFKNYADRTAELLLYGDIASEESWWRDVVSPQTFARELSDLGDIDRLTVRIFSSGGDPFAAAAIYEKLRDYPAKILVKVDGLAASAATVICMAGDEIEIAANGIFMIHDPTIYTYGYYNSTEMQKMMDQLAVVKKTIVEAYIGKTKLEEAEISSLMTAETWMSGREAVEKGFATRLSHEDTAVYENRMGGIMKNGAPPNFRNYHNVPQEVISCFKDKSVGTPGKTNTEETDMEIKNSTELRNAYPQFVQEIENAAVTAERERIQALEDMALPGFEDAVADAKFKNPVTAEKFAVRLIAEQKKAGSNYLNGRADDAKKSGVDGVKNITPAGDPKNDAAEQDKQVDAMLDKIFGEKA